MQEPAKRKAVITKAVRREVDGDAWFRAIATLADPLFTIWENYRRSDMACQPMVRRTTHQMRMPVSGSSSHNYACHRGDSIFDLGKRPCGSVSGIALALLAGGLALVQNRLH